MARQPTPDRHVAPGGFPHGKRACRRTARCLSAAGRRAQVAGTRAGSVGKARAPVRPVTGARVSARMEQGKAVSGPRMGGAVGRRFRPVLAPRSLVFLPEIHNSTCFSGFALVHCLPGWFCSGFQRSTQGNKDTDARRSVACEYDGGRVFPSIGNGLSPSPL